MRVDNSFRYRAVISSQLSSILMQLLFSFDHGGTRVEKTLVQTLASQLSSTLVLVWPGHESRENSHANSRFSTLMQLLFSYSHANSRFSTLINSHATPVLVWPGHESWENSHANSRFSTLINSHATLVFVWPGNESWENSHANSRSSTLINSHATLVFVWPGHESWENSHANSRFSTLINSHATPVLVWPAEKTLMQTLAFQLSLQSHACNSCSRLTGEWELRLKLSFKLSHEWRKFRVDLVTGG
jgi:hypothetical protein